MAVSHKPISGTVILLNIAGVANFNISLLYPKCKLAVGSQSLCLWMHLAYKRGLHHAFYFFCVVTLTEQEHQFGNRSL